MDQTGHHLRQTPIIRGEARHSDAGHNPVSLDTPVVVPRLYHAAAVEDLPGLGEGDLVELPPAVHPLAVPSLLCPKLLPAGAVLNVGAPQPGGQAGLLFPGQGNVVEH